MTRRDRHGTDWLGPECPDCGVHLDGEHDPNCDMACCTVCGGQWLECEWVGSCEGHDPAQARWRGVSPW